MCILLMRLLIEDGLWMWHWRRVVYLRLHYLLVHSALLQNRVRVHGLRGELAHVILSIIRYFRVIAVI